MCIIILLFYHLAQLAGIKVHIKMYASWSQQTTCVQCPAI